LKTRLKKVLKPSRKVYFQRFVLQGIRQKVDAAADSNIPVIKNTLGFYYFSKQDPGERTPGGKRLLRNGNIPDAF